MFIKQLTKLSIEILIALIIVSGIFYIFAKGFEGMEISECQKWQQEKQEFQDWYPADWQEKQCRIYKIYLTE